jgi:hypothetical protein
MKSKGNPYQQPAGYGVQAKIPAQATAGRSGATKAGVGMGVMDRCGPDNRFAGGSHSGVQYVHGRKSHQPG